MIEAVGIVGFILMLVGYGAFKICKDSSKRKWIGCLIIGIILTLFACFGGESSGEKRSVGRCWICGKSGSYQIDGSYYCHKHYNDRLFGRIG